MAGLLIAAGMGVVTGCGSSDQTADSASAPTSTTYFSPLDEYLRPPEGEAAPTSDEDWQAKEREVQDLIASCMTAEGFEYIPFVYPMAGMGVGAEEAEFDQREWTEKYGYGVSTFDTNPTSGDEMPVDPNNAIVEAMSEAEQQAYYAVLYGEPQDQGMAASSAAEPVGTSGTGATSNEGTAAASPGLDPADIGSTTGDSITGDSITGDSTSADSTDDPAGASTSAQLAQGCWGEAQSQVYGDGYLGGGDEFQEMWDAMSRTWETAQHDDRLTQVTADWAGCLADAGHPGFSAPQDPMDDVNRRWAELNGWPAMDAEMTAPPVEMTAEPTPPPAAEVATFKSEEIALALADYDCRVKVGYDAKFDSIRIEVETQFVQEHRAELERYRDEMNTGGG